MSFSNMATLYSYKHKKAGAIFTVIFFLVKLSLSYVGVLSDRHSLILNALISFSLYLVVFSKEKIDDERTQKLRYFSLKTTLGTLLGLLVAFGVDLEPRSISFLPIFILIYYLIVFYVINYFNPSIVFGNEDKTEGLSIGFIYIFLGIGLAAYLFVIGSNIIS